MPKSSYQDAVNLSEHWNTLYHRLVWDDSFIPETLSQTAKNDDFTARLLKLYQEVGMQNMKSVQPIQLAIIRSDYMLHYESETNTEVFKQVEMNTISAAFAHLSGRVSKMHSFLSQRISRHEFEVPKNEPGKKISAGIAAAHKLHPAVKTNSQKEKLVVLMIVQPGERNSVDQRGIEYNLWEEHGIPLIRKTLAQIASTAELSPENSDLIVDGKIATVAYFRAGYTPRDYPSESEWRARTLVEKSRAIKCPNIAWHLSGAKRVQQELTSQKVLEHFLKDADAVSRLMAASARQWNFNDPNVFQKVAKAAIECPSDFVLKPQREGGGNNFYGSQLAEFLHNSLSQGKLEQLKAFVLMERLKPKPHRSVLIRRGAAHEVDALSELGVYSVLVSNGTEIVLNQTAGHLLRTKATGVDEGGVASGFAVLDSPALV